jgi:hypothetical protein
MLCKQGSNPAESCQHEPDKANLGLFVATRALVRENPGNRFGANRHSIRLREGSHSKPQFVLILLGYVVQKEQELFFPLRNRLGIINIAAMLAYQTYVIQDPPSLHRILQFCSLVD